MTGFEWDYQPSGLGLRSDEFSVQGSFRSDAQFFLRRDLSSLNKLTDLNFGNLPDVQAAQILAEFLAKSGGLADERLEIVNIARRTDDHGLVSATYDRISNILKQALAEMGCSLKDAHLDENLGHYNSIVVGISTNNGHRIER